jgi:hypothetical protein
VGNTLEVSLPVKIVPVMDSLKRKTLVSEQVQVALTLGSAWRVKCWLLKT